MALRAIPNLWYVRPADANETAMAWRIALERPDGPVALALTRQKLPTFDRSEVASADGALRGAYTLWQRGEGEPDAIVIATGSEVHLALEAAQSLDGQHPRRLDAVLGAVRGAGRRLPGVGSAARASRRGSPSRPGVTLGWERYASAMIGIDHFGASAPYQRIFSEFGITAEAIAAALESRAPMRIAAAFDHRGVKLRDAVLESIDGRGSHGRRSRHRHRRRAHRLSGQGARARDGDPSRRDRARRARLRLRASAPRSRPRRSPASGPRSATTPTRRIRESSTTT